MWLANQQVQSMFQVIFMAAEFDPRTVSCLRWWHSLADCPEMAQTGVAVKYLVVVQDISQGMLSLCLDVSPVGVCDRTGQTVIS